MWDAKGKIQELNRQNEHEYNEYLKASEKILKIYADKKDFYNNQIHMINAEKIAMREELTVLYSFLEYIGGSLERPISIIDFQEEHPAPNVSNELVEKLDRVEYSDIDWGVDNIINTSRAKDFEKKKYWKTIEYKKSLSDKRKLVKRMEDNEEIAKLYRNVLTVVRDTIRKKVLPEFEYLRAFLIADAIREKISMGGEIGELKPCKIIEYRNTRYNAHYIFVKNTFDFLDLAKTFFSKRILTDLLQKGNITSEEREAFEKSVFELQDKLILLEESMEVSKRE